MQHYGGLKMIPDKAKQSLILNQLRDWKHILIIFILNFVSETKMPKHPSYNPLLQEKKLKQFL